jgi:hypothetical protein
MIIGSFELYMHEKFLICDNITKFGQTIGSVADVLSRIVAVKVKTYSE